jgi:signal peptidase II
VIGTLDLALTRNSGSAFSLFQGFAGVLVAVAVILVGALLVMVYRAPSLSRAAVCGLIIGGAIGNLSDRMFRNEHGAVVDFIDLHFWPTFNVADACIVIGCLLLALSLLRRTPGS